MNTQKVTRRSVAAVLATVTLGAAATLALTQQPVSAAQRGGGRLVIKGSDTLLPIAQPWAQAFSRQKPGADVSVTGGGSSTGITALINGTCDIANSSRKIRPGEIRNAKSRNVIIREFPVARDGLTIVVHPSNPVKSLSVDQVAAIYTGRVNNWSELGGPNLRIVTNGRDTSSGTYGFFQEDVLRNAKYRADMISTPSNNAIANNVANDRGGIGYIGVAYATEFVKAGKVKEVPISFTRGGAALLPTEENVKSGKYPISRYLYNYVAGTPRGLAADYLRFIRSSEGQAIVEKEGYFSITR